MNKSANFEDIYNDFFGQKEVKEVEKNISVEEIDTNIEELYITDASKELLKKIVNYITNYQENVYVNFNIRIITNNDELVQKIVEILAKVSNNYIDRGKSYVSLYKLDDFKSLEETFNKNGLIIFNNLNGLNIHDANFNKKLLYIIKEHLNSHKINIIVGTKNEISSLFLNNVVDLEERFNFEIVATDPTTNEIINDIENKVKLTDDNKIALFDYINSTFKKSSLNYPTYRDNLIKYISFNNSIPTLETVKTTEEIFKDLNELVGLNNVKKSLYELVDLINLKSKVELKLNNINLHMLFLGNPGTGKTTVARMLSNILYNLKYIRQNKLIEVSSKDLVAEYVGQTAPKTMDVINKALGGILFIDEAYALASDQNNSYNKEAIATLIKAMEDYRDDLVVIFAGYTKEMEDFINSNSGIKSRIGYTFIFDDYTNEELKEIFKGMLNKAGFKISKTTLSCLDSIIDIERAKDNFGNARFIRNLYEKTIIKHATNTKNIKDKNKLITITEEDIK
jgi:SpoVK/Ycf46/Vps4 family AAA+-type ATPase